MAEPVSPRYRSQGVVQLPDQHSFTWTFRRPRKDSNLRTRFRKPMLYPLSYGGQERIAATSRRCTGLAATAIVGPGRAPDLHLERTPLP
jgi:hypothetical protein